MKPTMTPEIPAISPISTRRDAIARPPQPPLASKRVLAAVLFLAGMTLAACDASQPLAPSWPSPSPSPSQPTSVNWRIQLLNDSQGSNPFGLAIRLDGEEIYRHTTPAMEYHVVELQRPYAAGTHTIELQILRAKRSPSVYRAAVTVAVTPGTTTFYDGVPTSLAVGEQVTLRVPL